MLDGIIKIIVDALFGVISALFRLLLRAVFKLPLWLTESRSERFARYQKQREQKLLATLTRDSVKNVVREGGKERVRIIKDGENFGAVLESYNPQTEGWLPLRTIGAGCVYDSPEAAEANAAQILPWLRTKSGDDSR